MRRMFGLAAVSAALLFSAPVTAFALGETCHPALSAKSSNEHGRHDAMWAAIDAWEAAATRKHGGNYDNWHYSGDRTVECKWQSDNVHFSCTAKARPCGPHLHD